jgi:hypothetical protein
MKTKRIFSLVIVITFGVFVGTTLAEWSEPLNLTELNRPGGYSASDPSLSGDGRMIYFTRLVPEYGAQLLIEGRRDGASGPFTSERVITELSNRLNMGGPWLSEDGLRLYYHKWVKGTTTINNFHVMMATRPSISAPWTEVRALSEIHLVGYDDAHPSLTPDELSIYWQSNRPGAAGVWAIWTATRPSISAPFSNVRNVAELNTDQENAGSGAPHITADGLTIYFHSKRNADLSRDVYVANRPSLSEPFGNIEKISICSPDFDEFGAYVTSDGRNLYFTSNRTTEIDQQGIWVSQWVEFGDLLVAVEKIQAAIAEKKTAVERIESAIAKELAAIKVLDEVLESDDFDGLRIDDILRARQRTNAAIQQQRASIQILRISIRRLEAALADLGYSAQDQAQAGPGRR